MHKSRSIYVRRLVIGSSRRNVSSAVAKSMNLADRILKLDCLEPLIQFKIYIHTQIAISIDSNTPPQCIDYTL